jgi:hypothetical protein
LPWRRYADERHHHRAARLFVCPAGIPVANAILAEFIKIFAVETTRLQPLN